MRVAVAGKGGVGKSVVAGTLARLMARRGHRVLALDSDPLPGMEISLGARPPAEPPLMQAAERGDDGRWRLRRGIGPVRAVQRFSTPAPDGVRLLQCGKLTAAGRPAIMPALQAYYQVIHHLDRAPSLSDWALVGDLPAGPRQAAFDWAPYADAVLVLAEPTWQSALTARRIARIARSREHRVLLVANRVGGADDVERVAGMVGERPVAALPADEAVAQAERRGEALVDAAPDAAAVAAIDGLIDRLAASRRGP